MALTSLCVRFFGRHSGGGSALLARGGTNFSGSAETKRIYRIFCNQSEKRIFELWKIDAKSVYKTCLV